MTAQNIPAIFTGLDAIKQKINKLGISKAREVTDGVRFKFRGIDDVMDVFSGPMAEAKVMVCPSYANLVVDVRQTKAGSPNYNVKVEGTLQFISLIDGSSVVAGPFYGEANDTADKAAAKAQSIAYRQGFLLTFTAPLGPEMDTEYGDQDAADTTKPAKPSKSQKVVKNVQAEPPKPETSGAELTESQLNILARKRDMAGITDAALKAMHPSIHGGNINQVLAALTQMAAGL